MRLKNHIVLMRKLQQAQRIRPRKATWKRYILTFAFFVNRFFRIKTRVVATRKVSDRVINAAKHDCIMMCRLAGVTDVVVADARYHLKCYIQIQFTKIADCEKKTRKSSDPKDMCMHKVAHEVSIGVTKGEIYNVLDASEKSVGLLSKLMLAVTSSTGHDLTISCKGCS